MDLMDLLPARLQKFHRSNQILGYYPGSLRSAITFVIVFTALSFLFKVDLLGFQYSLCTLLGVEGREFNVTIAGLSGLAAWIVLGTLRKIFLRRVLLYRGWLYERGKPSLTTKLFALTLRLFNGWKLPVTQQLYGLQGILPSLPVPELRKSVTQFVESMKPVVDEKKYAELKSQGEEFVSTVGPRFQRYLKLKSWFFPNYVSDWWEDYVYLMQRSSLLASSNYYAMDSLHDHLTKDQAARAAIVAWRSLTCRQQILENRLPPVLGQDVIPLCTWQYERLYNTARIPGETIDRVQHEIKSKYVVVYSKGKYFKINVYRDKGMKTLISPAELQMQFVRILNDTSVPAKGEEKLAALTAWDRTSWARARNKYFSKGANKESLDAIEKSAFVVAFDDVDFSFEYANEFKEGGAPMDECAQKLLCGNGYNRWIDKSVVFVVAKNGKCGAMGEHSWADGSVTGHVWEYCLAYSLEFTDLDENGRIATAIEIMPPPPERLQWEIPNDCIELIHTALESTKPIAASIDQRIFGFETFGRGLMKKCKVSPDAFIQMALQLAYYRDQGQFDLTYEPSSTRLYLQGRTETIRSCTEESCKWVLSMGNKQLPRETKIKYFQDACEKHQENFRDAMVGNSCDRHLFGLYVLSRYFEVDVPFLKNALSYPWKLSTSQAPFSQTKHKTLKWLGAGFATVSPDGYGVAYISLQEDLLFFHVSSSKTCSKTDSLTFSKAIQRSLMDIQELFFGEPKCA